MIMVAYASSLACVVVTMSSFCSSYPCFWRSNLALNLRSNFWKLVRCGSCKRDAGKGERREAGVTNEWTKGGGRHEDGLTFLAPGQVDVGGLGHCVFVGRSPEGTSSREDSRPGLASHSTWARQHRKVAACS